MPVIVGSERSFGILRDGGIHTHNRLFFFSLFALSFSPFLGGQAPRSVTLSLTLLLSCCSHCSPPPPTFPFCRSVGCGSGGCSSCRVACASRFSLSLSSLRAVNPALLPPLPCPVLPLAPPRPVNQSINQSISRLSRIFLLPPPLPLPSPTQCRRIAQKRNRGERARQGEGEGKRETRRGDKKGKKRRGRGR